MCSSLSRSTTGYTASLTIPNAINCQAQLNSSDFVQSAGDYVLWVSRYKLDAVAPYTVEAIACGVIYCGNDSSKSKSMRKCESTYYAPAVVTDPHLAAVYLNDTPASTFGMVGLNYSRLARGPDFSTSSRGLFSSLAWHSGSASRSPLWSACIVSVYETVESRS